MTFYIRWRVQSVDDREYDGDETVKRVEEVQQLYWTSTASSIKRVGIQRGGETRNNKHNK